MRLFQVSTLFEAYLKDFQLRYPESHGVSFSKRLESLTMDRYCAVHLLDPVLAGDPEAFFTWANDKELQCAWAKEHGLNSFDLDEILLAQIEEHRADVFYNLDPVHFDSKFVRRLPGCVEKTVCWRAAPLNGADLSAFDLCLSNFEKFIEEMKGEKKRAAWFYPSHDPVMANYAKNNDRPIDILFVGGYTRHHSRRNKVLKAVARMADRYRVQFHLNVSAWQSFNVLKLFSVPLPIIRLPKEIRAVEMPPAYGLELYRALSQSKIVVNISIDMAGKFRGNMRCWEVLGCGGCMVSDDGIYPQGMKADRDFVTFQNEQDCVDSIGKLLGDAERRDKIAKTGTESLVANYSKSEQWQVFQELLAQLS